MKSHDPGGAEGVLAAEIVAVHLSSPKKWRLAPVVEPRRRSSRAVPPLQTMVPRLL